MSAVKRLEAILAGGSDSASLRFALGSEYAKLADAARAIEHLRAAVALDPAFSAAWKLLGRTQADAGLTQDAIASYREGIRVATQRGDVQAAREMKVFVKRLQSAG